MDPVPPPEPPGHAVPASPPMPASSPAPASAAVPVHSTWRLDLVRMAAVLLAVAALIGLGYYLRGALRTLGPAKNCWENREIDGKLYSVNPCTGQFRLIGDVSPAPEQK